MVRRQFQGQRRRRWLAPASPFHATHNCHVLPKLTGLHSTTDSIFSAVTQQPSAFNIFCRCVRCSLVKEKSTQYTIDPWVCDQCCQVCTLTPITPKPSSDALYRQVDGCAGPRKRRTELPPILIDIGNSTSTKHIGCGTRALRNAGRAAVKKKG